MFCLCWSLQRVPDQRKGRRHRHHDPKRLHVPRLDRLQLAATWGAWRLVQRLHQQGDLLDGQPPRHHAHHQQRRPWHHHQPLPPGQLAKSII